MIPRELPNYLNVACSLYYTNEPESQNSVVRICCAVQRIFSIIKMLIFCRETQLSLSLNRFSLTQEFNELNQGIAGNQKPICIYFVSNYDNTGAILGKALRFYHHYKIKNLQKHFSVAAQVVSSQDDMKTFMKDIKQLYPQKEIKFIDIVSHGGKSSLKICSAQGEQGITAEELREDLFSDSASDATILLDACLTGLGDRNIADEIARKTPGRTVLAPGPSMYFSKPVIQTCDGIPRIVSVVHGFAIFNAYTCKSFSYPEKRTSQFPYVKDEFLEADIRSLASCPVLQNSWLDQYVDENREDLQQQVVSIFNNLSNESKTLIVKRICENEDQEFTELTDVSMLHGNPLRASVRSAFQSFFNELVNEVREVPTVGYMKFFFAFKISVS